MAIVYILLFGLLMQAVRSFAPAKELGASPGGTVLGAGYLLLTAYLVGSTFKRLGLPKLTGYLVTGIIAGPEVLGLVSTRMLSDLSIFNGVATALIALAAGSELEFRAIRPLLKTIRWISLFGLGLTMILLALTVWLARDMLPFLRDLNPAQLAAVGAVLGVTLASQSPAVVVTLRKELEADGPLVQTVLGLVVVAELVIVLSYTLSSAVAQAILGGSAGVGATAGRILWEIPGSLVIGIVIGIVLTPVLKVVKNEGALFIAAVGFLIAEVGRRVDLDVLLVALAAGLYIRNATPYGHRLHEDVEDASLPVFITFFSVAGATLHLDALRRLFTAVLLFAGVRAGGFLVGSRIGARIAGAAPA